MFCRSCGTENAEGSTTCTACGAVLTNPFSSTATPTMASKIDDGKPNNYLVWAVISNVCCCPIFGVVAVIYAAQVDARWNAGDRVGAVAASKNAFKWTAIALGLGILINFLAFGLQILGVVVAGQQAAGGGI